MKLRVWLFALFGFLGSWHVMAMTMEVQESTVFLSGAVDGTEWNKLRDVFDSKRIERIVFVNSPGGDLWAGMRVGRLIAEKNVQTVVVGRCVSSCSIMFMGGSERRFADTLLPIQTYVGIHGPHNTLTKQVNPSQAGQIYAFFAQRMGDKFNKELINTALFEMDDAGAMLYVYDPQRSPTRVPLHCRSETLAFSACTKNPGLDALSMGLITSAELVTVVLPESMREVPRIPGGLLAGETVEAASLYPELAQKQCLTDACKKSITDFPEKRTNRALALPVSGTGYGAAWGKDLPGLAFQSALYSCNHLKDKPARLCQVRLVNEVDVRSDPQTSSNEHTKALAELHLPGDKFYADEQYGGGLTKFAELRVGKVVDTTPQELPMIKTVGTQELARAILSPERPVVIDVTGADATLPTALPLLYGGVALADPNADAELGKRVSALLQLLAPDPNRMLVIVGYDRNDWRGVNAAVRATKAGYLNVAWYRGGLSAWKAANLPRARANFQAVAN